MALKHKSSQKKYSELLEKLDPELLKTLIAEETPAKISETCLRNGLEDEEKIKEVAYQVGNVLLGELSPEKFQTALEKEAKLHLITAKKIAEEINQNIFFPVKDSLEKVYKAKIFLPAKLKVKPPEEKPKKVPKRDIYREPIE